MKLILYILFILTFLHTGCDEYRTRNCPAFYYNYTNWQGNDKLDSLTFINNAGNEINFIFKDSSFSNPFIVDVIGGGTWGNSNPPFPTCWLNGTLKYFCPQLNLNLFVKYDQADQNELPAEEQSIYVAYEFSQDTGTLAYNHSTKITPEYKIDSLKQVFHKSLISNGKIYNNVLESNIDTPSIKLKPDQTFWKVYMSKGYGIFYLKNMLGEEYFLKE